MSPATLHRRLAVLMALAALGAFAAGGELAAVPGGLAVLALGVALLREPTPETTRRMEPVWVGAAALLAARAVYGLVVGGGDVVLPIIDLLLLLIAGEALKATELRNDGRLYALSFALLLAGTAYRPGLLFALSFVLYVILATLTLMVGHVRREARAHSAPEVPPGRRILVATAAVSALTLAFSGFVFVTLPRLPRGWGHRDAPAVRTVVGFSDEVSLLSFGSRIEPNPAVVLRVEAPDGRAAFARDLHWRGRAYDHFDGLRWSRTRGLPRSAPSFREYRRRWGGSPLRYDIFAAALDVPVLFTPHPLVGLAPISRIRPMRERNGDFTYLGRDAPAYAAYFLPGPPPVDRRRSTAGSVPPELRPYLQLPPLPRRVRALADSLTRGAADDLDRALAVQRWLRGTLRYTLDLPANRREASLESFLFERRAGHCEYFSTAMVVLLRSVGVPARNVNGFLGGEWNGFGGFLMVTQNQAHSWVEVWFPEAGWVTFDPTPGSVTATDRGREAWSWPGRFLFVGLEHRWSRWVLDYDLATQVHLLNDLRDAFTRRDEGPRRDRLPFSPAVLVALLALGGVGSLAWAVPRFRAARPGPEARVYLRLRRAYRRRGLDRPEHAGPAAFVEGLDRAGAPGRREARRVVEFYLRARFGGRAPAPVERTSQRRAAAAALRALRRERTDRAPPGRGSAAE